MLEGLEISILNFKEVFNNDFGRIDAEFFGRIFLKKEEKLKKKIVKKISEIAVVTDGEHGSPDLDENSGILYLSGHNVKENYIDFENIRSCSEKLHLKNLRSALKVDNVLMSIVGTIGRSSVVFDDVVGNTDRNVATIKEIDKIINPKFLSTFLNSIYGTFQTDRFSTGNVQPLLNLLQVKSILVPVLSVFFQDKIDKIITEFKLKRELSKQTYKQAENILLQEIGLKDFIPNKEPVNVKSFKDSFATSGRLDAEYYQPKYDDYLELIESYSNGSEVISTICNLNGKNYKPEDKNEYKYIELSNVGKTGDINGCTVNYGKELPSRARRKVNTGDVIISSIEGSLQSCALVSKEYNNALCSTGFYVINSDLINSESLLVLFKSELMQNILKQNCSGTILTGLNKDDFLNIRIPKIIEAKQQQIADLIEQSFSLKKQSEHLLEVAKKAVEIAIEEDEAVALAYIKEETR